MKNKMIIFGLLVLILITCMASVSAEDNPDNITSTTSDIEIETMPLEEEVVSSPSELTVTEDNYDNYFNKYTGKPKDTVDSNVNTIKISNVSDKIFTIDRPLNILPDSPDCEISNGVIHLIEGSDGSNITGLIIKNTKGEIRQEGIFVSKLHGIWLTNSSNNIISGNTIVVAEEEGCYAMPMGYSCNNQIVYNNITSHITSCIVMGSCHNNNISYNRIEMLSLKEMVTSNLIYFNPWGHADYIGPGDCIGNLISNNYLKGFCNSIWSIILKCEGKSDNTQIINNTVIKGAAGIYVFDDVLSNKEIQAKNILIKNNTVINSLISIVTGSNNVEILNNHITGYAGEYAIESINYDQSNISIHDNTIEYTDLHSAIMVSSDDAKVYDNKIKIKRYGSGISVEGSNVEAFGNNIKVTADNAIEVTRSNTNIRNNIISTFGKGITCEVTQVRGKVYNTTIIHNQILSDDYAVYIDGYVFNTTIKDNIVETNQSEAFYINVIETINDRQSGEITDNSVNGVIENTETLIIDDSNFYDYFDEEGYLTYEFKENAKRIIFFTFLTNKDVHFSDEITLTSNKMSNLLYNVSITLSEDACDSSIRDLKFYNLDKPSIILEGVENVEIKNNEFTTIANNIFSISTIKVQGGCENCNIHGNDMFTSSKSDYAFAISVTEPENRIVKRFSKGFDISNNNILIKTSGVGEGIYADALVESDIKNNHINVISDDSAYGISICNVIGSPHDINIDSNEIILNSKEMSYLIELYVAEDCQITNNYLKAKSNGIYGVAVYKSDGITINNNEIIVASKGLSDSRVSDSIGKGEAAILINRTSLITSISNNIFDVEKACIIKKDNSVIEKYANNSYVISNYNYESYFNSQNKLLNGIIKDNETILFKNFTISKAADINMPVNIKGYKHLNEFKAVLILSQEANNINITGLIFNDAEIKLNNVNKTNFTNNTFISTLINDNGGTDNIFDSNMIIFNKDNTCAIILENTLNDTFNQNTVAVNANNSDFIVLKNSNNFKMDNNSMEISGSGINVIFAENSNNNSVTSNQIQITGIGDIHAYYSVNSDDANILSNIINSNVTSNEAVICVNNSKNNALRFNRIVSSSSDGKDLAILFNTNTNMSNRITDNYLISSNNRLCGNYAVDAENELVCDNIPFNLYVSTNSNGSEDGSITHPYSSIEKALQNSLNGSVIYVLPGYYNESNLVIDKNITITAINIEGNVYIDALNNRLFNITDSGTLTVNALKIFNGFSTLGGSLFYNQGKLIINNSMIYNSKSYYNNSNPVFTADKIIQNTWNSYDSSNLGLGGAILNYGELLISSSDLFNNFAHKGGALADFGKTTIKNSIISDNTAVHGGAIYANSSSELTIENSEFINNTAITTLDYCSIQKTRQYPPHEYLTNCEEECGHGGAIYSNTSMSIRNSKFENNTAKSGGAIATPTKIIQEGYHDLSYRQSSDFGNIKLTIEDSEFRYNEAKDTKCGNQTMLKAPSQSVDTYGKGFHGGAIFASLDELHISNSIFEHNTAHGNGGALCVQTRNSTTTLSKFANNTAGISGGALDIFGNSQMFNTEILDNYAKNGGAIQYSSYIYYNHLQNNMNLFNVTVAGNKALDKGGAFLNSGNFKITNSNIYANSAPNDATFSGGGNVDARSNWWGSADGPDDSVWNLANVRFRTWLNDKVEWDAIPVNNNPTDDGNNGNGNNKGKYYNPSSSTGSSASTGSTLSKETSSHGSDSGGYVLPGNWPTGTGKTGKIDLNNILPNGGSSNSEGKTDVSGNQVNPNSLSKVNSSTVNDLSSIGMSANAADSSSGSAGSQSSGSASDSPRAYEITKEVKKEIKPEANFINLIFVVIVLMLIIIGFYRKYKNLD